MIQKLYRGATLTHTIAFTTPAVDELGNAINEPVPHADIARVRVTLSVHGSTVAQFSTDADDMAAGMDELTEGDTEGTYELILTSDSTAELPLGLMTMWVESTDADDGHVGVTTEKLRMVCSSQLI